MTQRLETTVLGQSYSLDLAEKPVGYWLVFLRLLAGWWFFHAGLNKFATPGEFDAGWFLDQTGTIVSPVLTAFTGGATEAFVNVAIPVGELVIGLGLILGCLTRLAAFSGAFLLFFFYFGNEAWRRGFVNGDLLGLVLFLTLLVFGAGRILGVDAYLEQTDIVQANPWLRYLLG